MIGTTGGVVVTGIVELDRMLRGMTPELNNRILGAANAEAAKPLIAAAKSIAPQGKTGNLKKSIGSVKISQRKATEIGTVHVGPRRGAGYKGHHGHLVEFGASNRPPGGWNKTTPTTMPSHPFMKPALDRTELIILTKQKEYIGLKLQAYMKRSLGKAFIK